MSPEDTKTHTPPAQNGGPASAARAAGALASPAGRRPKPTKARLDTEALKRARAEADAQAQRVEQERTRALAQAAELRRKLAKEDRARKRLQKEFSKKAALQEQRLRKRHAGLGARLLDELPGELWGLVKTRVKTPGLVQQLDEHFEELRELKAFKEEL
jgi:hypothetical protein